MSGADASKAKTLGSNDEAKSRAVNLMLPPNLIHSTKQRALAGDIEAATLLANHYLNAGQPEEEIRWRSIAGNRGDCDAMLLLKERTSDAADLAGSRYWNDMLRRHDCRYERKHSGRDGPDLTGTAMWD